MAYDATTLFVKVRAYDTDPDKIVTYLTRRDLSSPCDWIHVLVDSYHDRRTAYEFAVNPSGVKTDRYWFNDNNSDDSWDAVWDVSVSRDGSLAATATFFALKDSSASAGFRSRSCVPGRRRRRARSVSRSRAISAG